MADSRRNLDWPAWLTAIAAIATLALTMWLNHLERRAQAQAQLLENRRQALLEALQVIDLVHANTQFEGMPAPKPKPWDISKARTAMNGILIYSAEPERTLQSFFKALALHVPQLGEQPKPLATEYLNEFRNEVARELGLPRMDYSQFTVPWIFSLAGAE